MEMKCLGYYLVKPMIKPDWCTIQSSRILTVSDNDLSIKFPDFTKCYFTNYPRSDRELYVNDLGLTPEKFSEFCQKVSELLHADRLTLEGRFSHLEDVRMLSQYLRNVHDYRLVGLYTDSSIFSAFEEEGFFRAVEAGTPYSLGNHIGCEILGDSDFAFHSYLINSLNEVLEENVNLRIDDQTGLILNSYEETKQFCDRIQGMGESVIWRPFALYALEFTGGKHGSTY